VNLAARASIAFDLAIEHLSGPQLSATRAEIFGDRQPVVHYQPRQGWSCG